MAHSILVVDDSRSIRDLVSFTLEQAGYTVVQSADGDEALEYAREQKVDLVLVDLNMPKLNGIALIQKLNELPSYQSTPMLVLTTESSDERKMAGKAAGATGWITKPFDPDQLTATISKVLQSEEATVSSSDRHKNLNRFRS